MNRQISLLMIAVVLGVVIGAMAASRLARDAPPDTHAPESRPPFLAEPVSVNEMGVLEPDKLSEILESLTNTLNEEISERRMLAQQLEEFRTEIRELFAERPESDVRVVSLQAMDELFTEMGFTGQDREEIRRLEAATSVRAVELDDLARREGWRNTPRYSEEMEVLLFDNPIRDALGDDRYDRYLYARSRPNRVVVGSIMETSKAQQAGLQRADVIVRYGGEPVYSNMHLVTLRSSGEAGEPVVVEINRNGQPMQITMPRGPMGMGGHVENIDPRTNLWKPFDSDQ